MIDPTSYDNADFIPDGQSYFARWAAAAQAFRARHPATHLALDRPYGTDPRERYDLFRPRTAQARGLFIFLHGGFWRMSGRADWSHLANGVLRHGWAVALPSYPLAPEARIADITRSAARALAVISEDTTGPIVLAGHSAGGHLALRMVCPDIALPRALAARIAGVLAISPLADLAPLIPLPMNEALRIDRKEAEAESPIRHPAPTCPVQIEVGADERPSFVDQSERLAAAWRHATLAIRPGAHHFNIIEALEDPKSDMVRQALSMCAAGGTQKV